MWPVSGSKITRKVARKPRWSWGEMGRGSLYALFSMLHSGIPAPGIPYDWSILTVNVNHVGRLASRTQKRTKKIWRACETLLQPTFWQLNICHFDTRKGFSGSGRGCGGEGGERTVVFVQMLTGCALLSSRRFSLACFNFSLLARYFHSSTVTKSLAKVSDNAFTIAKLSTF